MASSTSRDGAVQLKYQTNNEDSTRPVEKTSSAYQSGHKCSPSVTWSPKSLSFPCIYLSMKHDAIQDLRYEFLPNVCSRDLCFGKSSRPCLDAFAGRVHIRLVRVRGSTLASQVDLVRTTQHTARDSKAIWATSRFESAPANSEKLLRRGLLTKSHPQLHV